jgi:hypothetical protein
MRDLAAFAFPAINQELPNVSNHILSLAQKIIRCKRIIILTEFVRLCEYMRVG